MMALILGFAFFTAGAEKIMGGWLNFSTQASRFYVLQSTEVFNRSTVLGSYLLEILPVRFWEIADYGTVIFEAGFIFAVLKVSAFRKFIFAALFFHLFIFLSMGITTSWLYIVYLLFIDWEKVCPRINDFYTFINLRRLLNIKFYSIASLCYLAIFIWGQHFLGMPSLTTVAILPIISEFFSINYYQFFAVSSILIGLIAGICILYISRNEF